MKQASMKRASWVRNILVASVFPMLIAGCGGEGETSTSSGKHSQAVNSSQMPDDVKADVSTGQHEEAIITFDAESFSRGKSLFAVNCVACHTPDGGARPHLGKDIVHSDFIAGISNKKFLTFLKTGRGPGDPLNTTGIGMPPKGGNPALNEDNLKDLIAFIRGRQATEGVEIASN